MWMKVTIITRHECEQTRHLAEAYMDNELMAETCLRIADHLAQCGACREYVARREWMKDRVRESVRAVRSPLGLEAQVRARLRAFRIGEERG